jgi:hypothetical protein
MSTLSIHPIMEYLRVHSHYEESRSRLLGLLGLIVKKVFDFSEQAATIAVVLLTFGLVIFGCIKIGETASVAASYGAAITEVVHPPLPAMPTGM